MVRIFLITTVFLVIFSGTQAGAETGSKGAGNRLEALPAPGQLQPVPRPPQLQRPAVPLPPPMPPLNRGAVNPRTGEFYPPQGSGIFNPKTGEYYPPVNGHGYFNPRTGEYYPRLQ
jgi:hypothetical protein